MAYLRKNGIWRPDQVPLVEFEFNYSHPLAQGLGCFYAPGGRYGPRDLTGRALDGTLTGSGNTWKSGGVLGPTINTDGSSSYIQFPNGPGNQMSGDFTIFAFNRQTVSTSFSSGVDTVFGKWFGGGSWGYGLGAIQNSTNLAPTFYWHSGGNDHIMTLAARAAWNSGNADPYCQLVTFGSGTSNVNAYYNGALDTNTNFFEVPATSSNEPMAIGARNDNGTWGGFLPTAVPACGVYTRVLSASEVAWLYKEPFAMLKPKVTKNYYIMSAVGGAPPPAPIGNIININQAIKRASSW